MKGPCDGLGGTCKRLAHQAVRSGKCLIQDAEGFYYWAARSNMIHVTCKHVSNSRCSESQARAKERSLQASKSTMKVHAVVALGQSQLRKETQS